MGLAGPGETTQPQTTLLDSSDSDPEAFSLSKIKGKGDMMEQAVQEEAAHKEEVGMGRNVILMIVVWEEKEDKEEVGIFLGDFN